MRVCPAAEGGQCHRSVTALIVLNAKPDVRVLLLASSGIAPKRRGSGRSSSNLPQVGSSRNLRVYSCLSLRGALTSAPRVESEEASGDRRRAIAGEVASFHSSESLFVPAAGDSLAGDIAPRSPPAERQTHVRNIAALMFGFGRMPGN